MSQITSKITVVEENGNCILSTEKEEMSELMNAERRRLSVKWVVPIPCDAKLVFVPKCLTETDPEERIVYGQEGKRMSEGIEVSKGRNSVEFYIRIDTAIARKEKCSWELSFTLLGKSTQVYIKHSSRQNITKKNAKKKN